MKRGFENEDAKGTFGRSRTSRKLLRLSLNTLVSNNLSDKF